MWHHGFIWLLQLLLYGMASSEDNGDMVWPRDMRRPDKNETLFLHALCSLLRNEAEGIQSSRDTASTTRADADVCSLMQAISVIDPSVRSLSQSLTEHPLIPSLRRLILQEIREYEELHAALKAHNMYRRMHLAADLRLNDKMSEEAREYAKELAKSGNPGNLKRQRSTSDGENLAFGCSDEGGHFTLEDATKLWYKEACEPGYDFESGKLSPKTAHFTQLAWAETRELGMGSHTVEEDNKTCTYIVGRYRPGGNHQGHFFDNVKEGAFNIRRCINAIPPHESKLVDRNQAIVGFLAKLIRGTGNTDSSSNMYDPLDTDLEGNRDHSENNNPLNDINKEEKTLLKNVTSEDRDLLSHVNSEDRIQSQNISSVNKTDLNRTNPEDKNELKEIKPEEQSKLRRMNFRHKNHLYCIRKEREKKCYRYDANKIYNIRHHYARRINEKIRKEQENAIPTSVRNSSDSATTNVTERNITISDHISKSNNTFNDDRNMTDAAIAMIQKVIVEQSLDNSLDGVHANNTTAIASSNRTNINSSNFLVSGNSINASYDNISNSSEGGIATGVVLTVDPGNGTIGKDDNSSAHQGDGVAGMFNSSTSNVSTVVNASTNLDAGINDGSTSAVNAGTSAVLAEVGAVGAENDIAYGSATGNSDDAGDVPNSIAVTTAGDIFATGKGDTNNIFDFPNVFAGNAEEDTDGANCIEGCKRHDSGDRVNSSTNTLGNESRGGNVKLPSYLTPLEKAIAEAAGDGVKTASLAYIAGAKAGMREGLRIAQQQPLIDQPCTEFSKAGAAAHNTYRRSHGVPDLKIDKKMTVEAQQYAEQLARLGSIRHSEGLHNTGENLAYACYTEPDKEMQVADAVKSWYKEGCNPGYDWTEADGGRKTNQFTQVVWKGTRRLGMGRAIGKKDDQYCTYIVAHYQPTGNSIGKYKDNVVKGKFNPHKGCSSLDAVVDKFRSCPYTSKVYESLTTAQLLADNGTLFLTKTTTTTTPPPSLPSMPADDRYSRPMLCAIPLCNPRPKLLDFPILPLPRPPPPPPPPPPQSLSPLLIPLDFLTKLRSSDESPPKPLLSFLSYKNSSKAAAGKRYVPSLCSNTFIKKSIFGTVFNLCNKRFKIGRRHTRKSSRRI